jgi:hypothetical protein
MAKAHITTKSGTKIVIEGTPEEVSSLVARFEGNTTQQQSGTRRKRDTASPAASKPRTKIGPVNLISELIDGGFFKKPKELSAIKLTLEEQGHYYPVTTLSPIMLRLVRKRQLRRIKEKNRWLYVG